MTTSRLEVQPVTQRWRAWGNELLVREWGALLMVTRGKIYPMDVLPGFVALLRGRPAGLALYRVEGAECELMSLNSLAEGRGIGTALIAAVHTAAREAGCRRLFLITTNDNTAALRFYQKRGFRLAALYANALDYARQLKPEIPLTGIDGIALRDEIELEIEC